jgi:hypothetical protein
MDIGEEGDIIIVEPIPTKLPQVEPSPVPEPVKEPVPA